MAIGAAALVPTMSGASAPPDLPAQTAQQLLVDIASAKAPELSGSLTWTANLGLSDLSALESGGGQSAGGASGGGFDPVSLLSGSHEIDIWLDGTTAEHLALLEPPAEEVDLVRNGDQGWLWDSATETVTHLVGAGRSGTGGASGPAATTPSGAAPSWTPQQWASSLLAHLSPTTLVTTGAPLYIAGQPAYQLNLAPRSATGSTVDHIEIDVGATGELSGVPLQVAAYATGQASPALELGFSGSLQVGAPPASELTFTPPPGAHVVTRTLRRGDGDLNGDSWGDMSQLHTAGSGWTAVISGTSASLANDMAQGTLGEGSTAVSFDGQHGQLFSTDLLNVLVLPDGRFYAGLVTPAVLEAAASATS
jgi:hypothetical protein